jgi:subfamily B ATP-binding cassette protein MsbA
MNPDLRLLWSSIRSHWKLVAATVLLSLGSALSEVFSIGMLIPFLQTFADGGAEPLRSGVDWVDRHVLAVDGSALSRTYRICGLILLGTWMRSLLGYSAGVYAVTSRVRIVEGLRRQIVDRLQSVSLSFFSKARGGDLLNSITTEINRTTAAVGVLFTVIIQGTLLLMYLGLMTWISWQLTLLVLTVFGLLSFGLTRLMRAVRAKGQWMTEASSAFTSRITEFIEGVRTVVAYNRQPFERRRLGRSIADLADATIATSKRSFLIQPLSQAIVGSVIVVLIVVAVQVYVIPGRLDIAFLLGFLFALFRLMPAVHNLNNQRGVWATNRAGLAKVAALIDPSDKPVTTGGSRPAPVPQDAIVFDGVDFAYEPDQPVLTGIDLRIPAGRMVALVGGSGAGKTTLADLIPRFHDPTAGRILLDGADLKEFDVSSLRERIGIISQHTYIFNDTVRANLQYGNLDASFDDLRHAAEQANALGFIEGMEAGFDTVLGDRGTRLSGGQRQRIAIARALLKDPSILIMDEATSNLDSVSEKLVQESVDRLMGGRTVIAIAHRLSTIKDADWVVVLEDGQIVEQGPYDALVARGGALSTYHRIQFQPAAP